MQAFGFGHWLVSRLVVTHRSFLLSVNMSSSYLPTCVNATPPAVTIGSNVSTPQTTAPELAVYTLTYYTRPDKTLTATIIMTIEIIYMLLGRNISSGRTILPPTPTPSHTHTHLWVS